MAAGERVLLWDAPTRIIHWALVLLIPFSWWSAEEHRLDWHRASGYIILGLLIFRLVWGFVGSSTSRFAGFVRRPRAVLEYARGKGKPVVGHNPLGGWSVVGLLLMLIIQVGLGLFAVDTDGLESGPLSHWVSFDTGRQAAELHELNFNVLLALIGVHIAAILFYLLVRRDNLVAPMFTGGKRMASAPGQAPAIATLGRAAVVALAAALLAWWVSRGLPLTG